jgi:UDP-N-acetylglucosamine--N-acetylmuramyl-(pentapeptide) pyrophosphoryl-undecaprenol N-acetylglucosamine transferase
MLSKFAKRICISWESSSIYFPKQKTVLTGNPLPVIAAKKDGNYFKDAANLPVLLVTGGSSGSHAVNVLIESALPVLLQEWRVFHQTGDALEYKDFSRLEAYKASMDPQLSRNYEIVRFVSPDQMEMLMKEAKIVVGRSGINTVSQLLRLGKPSLLIPLPAGQSGEQLLNAQVVEKKGMASILLQKDATSEKVIAMLDDMVKKYESFMKQASSAREMIREDAASKIVAEIEYVVKEKTS